MTGHKMVRWLIPLLLAAAVLLLLAGQFGLLSGTPPADLGVHDGKLKAPSMTPNSVSSQADLWPDHPQREYARIAPLPAPGDGSAALARLVQAAATLPGAQRVKQEGDYAHCTFSTRLLRFTDDLELWLDRSAGVVHVRSASRLGRRDFGVNRERVEALRAAARAAQAPPAAASGG